MRLKITNHLVPLLRYVLTLGIVIFSITAFAQSRKITGTVTDEETGEGLPGVTVLIKGSSLGTITDLDGNYSITLDGENPILVFSFVGYLAKEVPANSSSVLDVKLGLDIQTLDEVIVTGYGTQKKSVVTAAISKIDATDLARNKDLRIEQALQGRAAGVVIMNNSGQPGDNLTIRIRGTGTHGDPDPLFIVDGLPMEKEGMDYLNPADVTSIEVLKDGASSSIYGARGANGVVIITTKQGKKGQKMSVSYDGFYAVQNPWRKLDMLNAEEYIMIINEAADNDGRANPIFSASAIDTMRWDTDWQDEMYYKNAPKMSHSVSFTGGSDNGTYSSSINYYSQDGIVGKGKSNFERITFRLNTMKSLNDRVTIGSNTNLINITTRGIEGNSQFGTGIIQALNMPPIVPVQYDNGKWGAPNQFGIGLQEISNPVAMLSYLNREATSHKALGNVFAEIEIIKGLKFKTNYGSEIAYVKGASYTPVYELDPTHRNLINQANRSIDQYVRWNLDNTLTYTRNIGRHNASIMAGTTHFRSYSETLSGTKDSLIFDDFQHAYLNNSLQVRGQVSNGYSDHRLLSYFGRLSYDFDERYMVQFQFRRDGSSRFGPLNKYANFYSMSTGWVFTREAFFPENNILEFGKLRFSWGQNGNEAIGDFRYNALIENGLHYFFGDGQDMYNGMQPDFYPNEVVKWETAEQLDLGLDLTFFTGRISFAFDYYEKRTKDWLIVLPAPRVVGNNVAESNGGGVLNKGMEFELGYTEDFSNKLKLDIFLTAATNRSKVTSLNNVNGQLTGGTGSVGQNSIIRIAEGQPLGYFWGFKTEGTFKHPAELEEYPHQPNADLGDLKFVDLNGDGTLDDNDRTNIGNPYPKWNFGLNTSVSYAAFDLSMFWYTAVGHQIWMANRRNDLFYSNYPVSVLDRWTVDNRDSDYPKVTLNDPNQTWKRPSDFFVHDANFLRLKNVTLGYTLPVGLTNNLKIQKLRIYVTSENLITFTKYPGMEVEVGGGPLDIGIDHGVYPQSRTFLGGISFQF